MPVTIKGLDALLAKFEDLGSEDRLFPVVAEAVKSGAAVAYEGIQAATPVSTDRWTSTSSSLPEGELKAGLIRDSWTTQKGNPATTVKFTDQNSRSGQVSPREVARWVNAGHWLTKGSAGFDEHGRKTGEGAIVRFAPGSHFFTRAVENVKPEVRRTVKTSIRAALRGLAKGQK